jgi:protein phosphatase PTC7
LHRWEDAFFLHPKGVGVADGVSSWSTFKIKTSDFSKGLMDNAKEFLEKKLEELDLNVNPQIGDLHGEPEENVVKPDVIMDLAFYETHFPGSSTCCIGVINKNKLDICNLGDSGFMSFEYKDNDKNNKVFLKQKSKNQQHSFNYPYQLVKIPDESVHQKLIEEGHENISKELMRLVESDAIIWSTSKDGQNYSLNLKANKIVVFGTDGLFDNLFVYELTNIINEYIKNNSNGAENRFVPSFFHSRKLAKKLVKRAYFKTKDHTSKTPFQKEYYRAKGRKYIGGKVDDITAVVLM